MESVYEICGAAGAAGAASGVVTGPQFRQTRRLQMQSLALHEIHERRGATFLGVNGVEAVAHYGAPLAEYAALRQSAGVLDLSCRSRICLLGADRQKFLNGQVTNNVRDLQVGEGCYAALVTAKGRIESDLNVYRLEEELLLDFEPGLTGRVSQRLEKYIIADDVQLTDAGPHYGLISFQGPRAAETVQELNLALEIPPAAFRFSKARDARRGEFYLMNQPRVGTAGYDLYVPSAFFAEVWDAAVAAAAVLGGRPAGWEALEIARIEAGVPRFGADMDETNLAPEAGIESRAISYSKGCYIGQEVIARIRTYGQVAKSLRGLRLADDLPQMPVKGDKLFQGTREVGYITSAARSPALGANIALGYVRREVTPESGGLILRTAAGESAGALVDFPFQK